MTSHAQDPGDSVSAARITAYSGVGAALIGAIAAVITGVVSHDNGPSTGPMPTTISHPRLTRISDQGSVDKVEINASGTEVTVTGSAAKDIDSVAVLIGPREPGGQQYWANVGSVSNQQWKLTVATKPHLPELYKIETRYHSVSGGAASENAFKLNFFQGTEAPKPPPTPTKKIVKCAEQSGPDCFTGPGWGPPSVYQSNQ